MENQENNELLTQAFDVLLDGLAPYVVRELIKAYGDDFWQRGVLDKLYDDQKRNLPASGDFATLTDSLDISMCLLLVIANWREVFRVLLPNDCKSYATELRNTRNNWAHRGMAGISTDDTRRALDTMSRLANKIDDETLGKLNALQRKLLYGSEEGSSAAAPVVPDQPAVSAKRAPVLGQTKAASGLPSWRDVMEPQADVSQGRYKKAEFAADLGQVARGEGNLEYRDPVEFFNRTYVTEGMKGLLVQSLRRVAGLDGDPVIQLKTAFGGGKTHSMLALYHMMRSRERAKDIEVLAPVIAESGVSEIPEVHVAVIVGTTLDAAKSKRPATLPGNTVSTIWGEIAFQLAESAGRPELYDYVKEADKRGVAPGSEALARLFDDCGCCLILMDELVAYGKKLDRAERLPAGTLDNFITFIQELTEAARASKNSLVVASIPESEKEIGGEGGHRVLDQIEHTFGRMEAIWKPVAASEGFEVVRRRLFLGCKDEAARERVCNEFSKMYAANPTEFPVEARELDYRDRMMSCYPIHPEVFDRLYEDWATLEDFQRTRSVLRLMAMVIHELWMNQDPSPMIMPGSFPFDTSSVRDELTRYLDENWNGVVDSEVDGKSSVPYRNDASNQRYGNLLASRRMARAVMLGSAPDVGGQAVRGIEKARVRLGVVQPGENISVFNDALGTLQASSSFLYSDASGNRFWYDTRPTLRKVAEDRARQVSESEALYEVERRLKALRKTDLFSGIHVCPSSSLDVPDEQSLRLVVISPSNPYRNGAAENRASAFASDVLSNRGTSQRVYKNMLVFAACDFSSANALVDSARQHSAWSSICAESERLNLDAAQNREANRSLRRADELLEAKIQEAYCWLLYPRIDLEQDSQSVIWEAEKAVGGGQTIVDKMAQRLVSSEAAIKTWAPVPLLMELDRVLWKDREYICIKDLWTYLCSYCYLSRLSNYEVLERAIRNGLSSSEYFGISAGYSDGRFIDLTLGQNRGVVNLTDVLVKPSVARRQIDEDARIERERKAKADDVELVLTPITDDEAESIAGEGEISGTFEFTSAPKKRDKTSFAMRARLDRTRLMKDLRNISDEILSQFNSADGVEVELTFEIKARAEDGMSPSVVRTVSENCSTLGISDFRFD